MTDLPADTIIIQQKNGGKQKDFLENSKQLQALDLIYFSFVTEHVGGSIYLWQLWIPTSQVPKYD